jgi:hypothetical protein
VKNLSNKYDRKLITPTRPPTAFDLPPPGGGEESSDILQLFHARLPPNAAALLILAACPNSKT